MKYWFDTEFIEDGKTIDLLSIGIVAEDGRELYLESAEADKSKASDWVKKNVLPHLHTSKNISNVVSRREISIAVGLFVNPTLHGKPEFWGYYADYDWVVLCQLFGTMMNLPEGWPMFCMDIKQLCVMCGDPRLPEQGKGEHSAIADARWNLQAYKFLLHNYADKLL